MRADSLRAWACVLWLCASASAMGGACENYSALTNGGFESPLVSGASPPAVETYWGVKLYNQANVPGWRTLSPFGLVEFWQSGLSGVTAYEGTQFTEVQGASMHSLYQDVPTAPGSTLRYSFAHRGRTGTDTLQVRLGPAGATTAQLTVSTGTSGWRLVTGTYTVPANQTTTRFELRPVRSAAGGGSIGNLVDAVSLQVDCDYGDAPAAYGVRSADGGAAHVVTGARLGTLVDAEPDGVPSAGAGSDDLAGIDDEDGLQTPSSWNLGANNQLTVRAGTAGFLNAWVDVNRDGVFQGGERLVADAPVVAGSNTLAFGLPASGSPGNSVLRLRFSANDPAGTLGPTGVWPSGEVEDHAVVLVQAVHRLWHFDEFEWAGVAGEILDSGPAGGGATAGGAANTGHSGPALTGPSGTCSFGRFDGVDDVVLIGALPDFDVAYPPDRLTMAAWIRPRLIANDEQLVLVRGLAGAGSSRLELALYLRAGRYELRQRRGASVMTIGAAAPAADLDAWTHLAAVFDGTNWRLYRNGTQIAASGSVSGPFANSAALWAIGARHPAQGGFTSPFTGDIDEVNLWRRSLSPAEIAQLPLQRHPCPQANLTLVKSVQPEADVHGVVNAKSIPASTAVYTISVTNSGNGGTDAGTLVIDDVLPADVEFWSGDFDGGGSPVQFVDGVPPSGLSLGFLGLADATDDVEFLDAAGMPVVPNGTWDPAVRTLRVTFGQRLRPAGRTFALRFRVRLR